MSTTGRVVADVIVAVAVFDDVLTVVDPDFNTDFEVVVVDTVELVAVSFVTCAFQFLTISLASRETSLSVCVFILLTNKPISVFSYIHNRKSVAASIL